MAIKFESKMIGRALEHSVGLLITIISGLVGGAVYVVVLDEDADQGEGAAAAEAGPFRG